MSDNFMKKYPTEKTEEEKLKEKEEKRKKELLKERERLLNTPVDLATFPDGFRDK